MKIKKRILSVALALLLALGSVSALPSCSSKSKARRITLFDYFNTFSTLTAYSESEEEFNRYRLVFEDTLAQYHNLLNTAEAVEGIANLHTLNESAYKEPVKVSEELLNFLKFSVEMHLITDGYTSITMGSVTSLWKDALKSAEGGNPYLPSQSELDEAARHTDVNALLLDDVASTVRFADSKLMLDAGALAKGYASKILYDRLIEAGCESFLINLGGNITAHGQKSNASPWLGGIENPTNVKDVAGISIDLTERSISTSGSYNQYFIYEDQRYHHIINPYTLYPENEFVSVSVITSDVALADALSTALFSMSAENGLELVNSIEDTEAIWITSEGDYFSTDGIDSFIHK